MAVIFRHFRPFVTEAPRKGSSSSSTSPRRKSKQHLQVKISKEPPTILYFERVQGEQCREYIFDPMVRHDEEKDHPDLFMSKRNDIKPWQKPPYCNTTSSSNGDGMMKRLTSMMRIKSSSSSTPCPVA
ncbi:unnamed protein product [Absidia cylindrospora]